MLAKGNGRPEVCASNLMRTHKKEAFYGRRKGVTTTTMDSPFVEALSDIKDDAEEMLEEFEPRVSVNEINADYDAENNIVLKADIDISENEELNNDEDDFDH
jgi:phage baseplate assembly protein W